jgi:hypothetical protein
VRSLPRHKVCLRVEVVLGVLCGVKFFRHQPLHLLDPNPHSKGKENTYTPFRTSPQRAITLFDVSF